VCLLWAILPDWRLEMKLQACRYYVLKEHKEEGKAKIGVALVKEFGLYDVICILDEEGKRAPTVWDYQLLVGPAAMLDTAVQTY